MKAARAGFALAERAYREADSDRSWLQELLEPAERLIGRPARVSAVTFRVDVPERVRLMEFAGLPQLLQGLQDCLQVTTAEVRAATFAAGPVVLLSDRVPRENPAWGVLARNGVKEVAGMVCRDSGPIGCTIGINLPDKLALSQTESRRMARAAAHVATAMRLRLRAPIEEAVLAPDGRLLDAQGRAKAREHRDALRQAVRSLDRVQVLSSREPDRALDAWRALVDGRWSLVERFDSDGRRFWIARENEPVAKKVRRLSVAERQVIGYVAVGHSQKLIAYELGLTESTISKLATSARNKLGVSTRAQLIELYLSLHGPAHQREPQGPHAETTDSST